MSKGPQWGSFVQLLKLVPPNPHKPPVTATGKTGMLEEMGGLCVLLSVWLYSNKAERGKFLLK